MRCRGIELAQDAYNFHELGHKVGLVLEPAGGIDQQHVRTFGLRLLQGCIGQTRGVATDLAGNDLDANLFAPDL